MSTPGVEETAEDVLGDLPPTKDVGQSKVTKRTTRMSVTSEQYDVGNKGYLDESEKILRSYDTNNDGQLDMNEMKKVVHDLTHNTKQKKTFRKYLYVASVALVLVCVCNFGLVWARSVYKPPKKILRKYVTTQKEFLYLTNQPSCSPSSIIHLFLLSLILARQVETLNGEMVDAKTGQILTTRTKGDSIAVSVNPEFRRRLFQTYARRLSLQSSAEEFHRSIRQLEEEVPVGSLEQTDVDKAAENYRSGTPTVVNVEVDGVKYSGTIGHGVTLSTNDDGCNVYDKIVEDGTSSPFYTVTCCGENNDECEVFRTSGRRKLYNTCSGIDDCHAGDCDMNAEGGPTCGHIDEAFSPLTTVMEQTKGVTPLKDIKAGDQILTPNGYTPVSTVLKNHPHKVTKFIQIYTEPSNGSPLEVSEKHMLFLEGRENPIKASRVQVGDKLSAVDGTVVVTKVKEVSREGFYNVITSDCTLVADGIHASALMRHEDGPAFRDIDPIKKYPIQILVIAAVAFAIISMVLGCMGAAIYHVMRRMLRKSNSPGYLPLNSQG